VNVVSIKQAEEDSNHSVMVDTHSHSMRQQWHLARLKVIFAAFVFGGIASWLSSLLMTLNVVHSVPSILWLNFMIGGVYFLSALIIKQFPSHYKLAVVMVILAGTVQLTLIYLFMPDNSFRSYWFPVSTIIMFVVAGVWAGILAGLISIIALIAAPLLVGQPIPNLHSVLSLLFAMTGLMVMGYFYIRHLERAHQLIDEKTEQLMHTVRTDLLTGVYNRLGFFEEAERLIKLHRREHQPFVVGVIDLDHFKQINDSHGHEAGDEALKVFAGMIQKSLRSSDLVGRMGGDEFMIFLSFTDCDAAKMVYKKLSQNLQSIPVKTPKGSLIHLQASIGFARKEKESEILGQLVKRADEALYQAKREGRNQCVCAE
jgi:diguanylate cyclase (GGDEF)-like protein